MKSLTALAAMTLLAGSAADGDERLLPVHFARGVELLPTDGNALQSVLLPLSVYRGVVRSDLGDVRVFNAAGREVPHAIRSHDASPRAEAPWTPFPLFPVEGAPGTRLDDLDVELDRTGSGTVLRLRSAPAEDAGEGRVLAWILDASAVERPVDRLELSWEGSATFVAALRVEASEDLARWRPVVERASIASLQFSGRALDRHAVELPRTRARYLRLSAAAGGSLPVTLSSVRARVVPERAAPARRFDRVAAEPADGDATWRFDVGGPVPVDRVSVVLPQRNTLVDVTLSSAASPEGPWRRRHEGVLYRVMVDGEEVTSEHVPVGPTRDRWWKLAVAETGGGLGGGEPQLEVGWVPEQVLFVARGEPPFLLAHGSHRAGRSTFDVASLLAVAPGRSLDDLPAATAELGRARELGGEAALTPPPPPLPWKTWTLWILLVAGVAGVAWMAVRLARQIGSGAARGSDEAG